MKPYATVFKDGFKMNPCCNMVHMKMGANNALDRWYMTQNLS